MPDRVAIIGVGYTSLRPISPEVSFREMVFEAAVKAYADAGIDPQDVSTFVSITEGRRQVMAAPAKKSLELISLHQSGAAATRRKLAPALSPRANNCFAARTTTTGRFMDPESGL